MCIICSDPDLGQQYLDAIGNARHHLKTAEDALLKLGKKYPKSNYDLCHKKLVKIRKSINEVEELRESDNKH
jgi:hypothetical protein